MLRLRDQIVALQGRPSITLTAPPWVKNPRRVSVPYGKPWNWTIAPCASLSEGGECGATGEDTVTAVDLSSEIQVRAMANLRFLR